LAIRGDIESVVFGQLGIQPAEEPLIERLGRFLAAGLSQGELGLGYRLDGTQIPE